MNIAHMCKEDALEPEKLEFRLKDRRVPQEEEDLVEELLQKPIITKYRIYDKEKELKHGKRIGKRTDFKAFDLLDVTYFWWYHDEWKEQKDKDKLAELKAILVDKGCKDF